MTVAIPDDRARLAQLRDDFDDELIGKLPRITCKDCSGSRDKVCASHSKSRCDACANYITGAHIHLDYVGHAAVTDRLLQVDPMWTWDPMGFDSDGLPAVRVRGNQSVMWIRLTVLGVTRPGVGIASSAKDELEKELISDALRNASMRFGVALKLWSKQELSAQKDDTPPPPPPNYADLRDVEELLGRYVDVCTTLGAAPSAWRAASLPSRKTMGAMLTGEVQPMMQHDLENAGLILDALGQTPGAVPPAPESAVPPEPEPAAPASTEPLPPCSICGSTKAARTVVRGVVRCERASACSKRLGDLAAAAIDAPPSDEPAPEPEDDESE